MKQIFILLFATFSLHSFSQNIEKASLFFSQDKQTLESFFQSILDETGKKFSFLGVEPSQGKYNFKFFDESTRGSDSRSVYFYTFKLDTNNPDLEIEGPDLYTFGMAIGRFLDFAKWWIKYINPNETLESLSAKGKDKFVFKDNKGNSRTLQLLKYREHWMIRG